MTNLFVRFTKNESGATAIEYGLIVARILHLVANQDFALISTREAMLQGVDHDSKAK